VDVFRQLALAGFAGLFVTAIPMVFGIAFAVRPGERLLALMRPLTLAAIFAAVAQGFLGLANMFQGLANIKPGDAPGVQFVMMAEVSVVPFLSFVLLSVAWLCVAIGMRRQP